MSLKDQTKRLFAETLEEMMRSMPLSKVRIKDLCARCGADRQSFYYHFRDKYDLVAWIFMQDYAAALEQSKGAYTEERVADNLRRMQARQPFYRNAYRDWSQNSITEYIYHYYVTLGINAVSRVCGEDALDTETVYAIKSHTFACIGHTLEWLEGKTDYTPEEFAHLQFQFMPDILKTAYGTLQL